MVQGRLQDAEFEDAPLLHAADGLEPCPNPVERKLQLRARPFRVKCFVAADKVDPVPLECNLDQIPEAPTALVGAGEDVPPQDHVGEESLRDLRCALGDVAVPAGSPLVPGFRVLGGLGSGGQGTTWLAARESDGLTVALKVVQYAGARFPERYWTELSALRERRLSCIARLVGHGIADGHPSRWPPPTSRDAMQGYECCNRCILCAV